MADKKEVFNALNPQAQAALRKQQQKIDKLQTQYDALHHKDTAYAEVVKTLLDMHKHGLDAMNNFYTNAAYNLQWDKA